MCEEPILLSLEEAAACDKFESAPALQAAQANQAEPDWEDGGSYLKVLSVKDFNPFAALGAKQQY